MHMSTLTIGIEYVFGSNEVCSWLLIKGLRGRYPKNEKGASANKDITFRFLVFITWQKNPAKRNKRQFKIIAHLQKREGIHLKVQTVR